MISEVFRSFIGEGRELGRSAVFIRIAGCDIRCSFCDEKKTWSEHAGKSLNDYHSQIKESIKPNDLIVVTGGEPLQHIDELQSIFANYSNNGSVYMGGRFLLETSGNPLFNMQSDEIEDLYDNTLAFFRSICISPKNWDSGMYKRFRSVTKNWDETRYYFKFVGSIPQEAKNLIVGEYPVVYLNPLYDKHGNFDSEKFKVSIKDAERIGIDFRIGLQAHKHWGLK